jgi:hypothetical protein
MTICLLTSTIILGLLWFLRAPSQDTVFHSDRTDIISEYYAPRWFFYDNKWGFEADFSLRMPPLVILARLTNYFREHCPHNAIPFWPNKHCRDDTMQPWGCCWPDNFPQSFDEFTDQIWEYSYNCTGVGLDGWWHFMYDCREQTDFSGLHWFFFSKVWDGRRPLPDWMRNLNRDEQHRGEPQRHSGGPSQINES